MTESRGPLTRRPIVTEGIFEKDGALVDLPKPVSRVPSEAVWSYSDPSVSQTELKLRYGYRLIHDESISFDTVRELNAV